MTEIKNGRRFSLEFEKATEVNEQTMVLIQTPNNPVQKAEVGQIKEVVNRDVANKSDLEQTNQDITAKEKKLREDVDAEYAKKNGAYPKMTVGFAQEIVGDGSATPEEFSFRPTAGEERNVANTTYYEGERNGVARIEKVKGNSVVWNQRISTSVEVSSGGLTLTPLGGNKLRVTGALSSDYQAGVLGLRGSSNWRFGDKIFVCGCPKGGSSTTYSMNDQGFQYEIGTGAIWEVQSYFSLNNFVPVVRIGKDYVGVEVDLIYKPIIVNLTQMFGAGNEPTTVEEFYERLPKGVDINAYNGGEIINGNYGEIKTVGFNAFNGTYAKVCGGCPYYLGGNYTSLGFATEKGGTLEAIALPTSTESVGTTPSDRLYTPSQNGYIYAEGENININLSWDTEYGYLNGTYQPYKPFTRDLSWVSKYFPNGMRSAGSARDEIRFNSTTQKWEAAQKVGVVDLGSLTWSHSEHLYGGSSPAGFRAIYTGFNYLNGTRELPNLLCNKYTTITANEQASTNVKNLTISAYYVQPTRINIIDNNYTDVDAFTLSLSGVMLNYELPTPIITEIVEDINLDYDVSDYGTEELIVAEGVQSAPLVADVTYAPNALSTIKQVPDILKRLKALESAVAQQTTNVEPSNIEE